jgi:uncharacterized Tic20 family protein
MNLRDQYEKENGYFPSTNNGHEEYFTDEYVAWLESKVESQMTEEKAKEILNKIIKNDNNLCLSTLLTEIRSDIEIGRIELNGIFYVDQLKAIAWWMENKNA